MGISTPEQDAFLKEIRIGFLSTLNADGSPNTMPLWYHWDGEKIRMFSSRDTGKIRRLAADNRANLSVAQGVGIAEAWVTVEGTVEVLDEGGRELACRMAALYYKPKQAGKTIEVWEKKDDWVLIELTPTRIRS